MDTPFLFFFGLLGLAVGTLVVWLLLADHPFEGPEPPLGPVDKVEATMLARAMEKRGRPVDEETVVDLIELHTAYLEGRISEQLALTAADRVEAARAKSEAEAAQTAAVPATQAADIAACESATAEAAAVEAATPASSARDVRTRKPASTLRAQPAPRPGSARSKKQASGLDAPTPDADLGSTGRE